MPPGWIHCRVDSIKYGWTQVAMRFVDIRDLKYQKAILQWTLKRENNATFVIV